MEFFYITIFSILSAFIIFWINRSGKVRIEELKNDNLLTKRENNVLQKQHLESMQEIAELRANLKTKEEQLKLQQSELINTREQLNKDFQVLANQILEEKTVRFTDINKFNIESILKPLNEKLTEFKSKVEETYDKESKQRFSLEERIRELVSLNQQISEDANNLTKALKGNNKVQGNWGEMILESILEKSGLKKGEEYYAQDYLTNENGERILNDQNKAMQPDIIVAYPGGRKIIIDSKVSLTGYLKYIEAGKENERLNAEKETFYVYQETY